MSLIAMAVFDTVENKRSEYTRRTLDSLFHTVNFTKHRLTIIDNNSCQETKDLFSEINESFKEESWGHNINIITNPVNLGTAEAINLAWKERLPGENCVKMDNDVIINHIHWLDELDEAVKRDPSIGQIGLKRKDCAESPTAADPHFTSSLRMLPHEPGESWIIVEDVSHVMGTCVLHNSSLLERVGYLNQPGVYGFDDSFMSLRSQLAGFKNCFLSHINIDHIDTGENPYSQEKVKLAAKDWPEYVRIAREYINKQRPLYYNPFI